MSMICAPGPRGRAAGKGRHGDEKPRATAPPIEPRIAYPDPQPSVEENLALIRGKTFFAASPNGDIKPPGGPQVGLFLNDTRYLSQLELRVNGSAPVVLSSTTEAGSYLNRIEMAVKGALKTSGLDFPVNALYLRREQILELDAFYDLLRLKAFEMQPARLTVEITCGADFMDIFQVRGVIRGKSGRYFEPAVRRNGLLFLYEGLDHQERRSFVSFEPAPSQIEGTTARWEIELDALATTQIGTMVTTYCGAPEDAHGHHAHSTHHAHPVDRVRNGMEEPPPWNVVLGDKLEHLRGEFQQWQRECTLFHSDNDIFNTMLRTSGQDFYSLKIQSFAGGRQNSIVAAGVPWFAAIFGRDSIIASFETLGVNPTLAQGTLRTLAACQGKTRNDARDEEPGKIVHEIRCGEMAATGEIAFARNYGSVDATPLFIMLLSEYYRWTGDKQFLREMEPALTAAVRWILEYGDLDGDGLIEYQRKSPQGLFNQGWKDSGDANLHKDGSIAQPPIALIEVQGYAAAALTAAASLYRILDTGEPAHRDWSPSTLGDRATHLRRLIASKFWLPERRYYAMALDGKKRPLEVVSSNPGHLLFANAIPPLKARDVMQCLLSPELFSGWGIRTLSRAEPTFNPMSYHRGSIWPHDNALIAYGLASYGFRSETARVASALYDSALYFRGYRLPELFCGVERRSHDEPVHYPVSCSPQAWASGAPFLLLRAALGLRVDAAARDLKIVDPHLPPFINRLTMQNMRIGDSRVSLEFLRQGKRTFCNLHHIEGGDLAVSVVYH